MLPCERSVLGSDLTFMHLGDDCPAVVPRTLRGLDRREVDGGVDLARERTMLCRQLSLMQHRNQRPQVLGRAWLRCGRLRRGRRLTLKLALDRDWRDGRAAALRSPRQDDNTGRDEDEQGDVETRDEHGFQCKQRANTASVRPPGRECVDLRETLHHDG